MLQLKEIRKNIYSIKAISYNELDFHGTVFRNDEGASYNAYLVIDEEVTLIDTVEHEFNEAFLKTIDTVLNGRPIDNIIINHVEPDHSSSFLAVFAKYPNAKCYCSEKAEKPMQNMFFANVEYKTVKTMDSINTGKYTFNFILTPFVHWPDNMVTYLVEEKILFSNDAFGNLVANNNLYDDQYDLGLLLRASKEYYANIVMPCAKFVLKTLKEIEDLGIEIELICPAHGIIWRSHIADILEQYKKWANFESKKNKVVIVYDTIWGNTEIITNELGSKLADQGLEVRIFRAGKHRPSLIMTEILDASAIVVGTSNFNSTMLPTIADFIERMYGLKPKGKIGAVYGAYGWSKAHVNRVKDKLKECDIDVIDEDITSNYKPDTTTLDITSVLADKIVEALNAK